MSDTVSPTEVWKAIAGYDDLYSVSNLGRIRRETTQQIIKQFSTPQGYRVTQLCKNGIGHTFKVARLVGKAFLDPTEDKPQLNHKNGDKTDDRAINLEWCNQSENIRHRYRVLLKPGPRGGKHWKAKLTELDVFEIRNSTDIETHIIAQKYNISSITVRGIITGRTWKHLIPPVS